MKTLIINGHPDLNSFTTQLAEGQLKKYQDRGEDVELLNVVEMKFDPISKGYGKAKLSDEGEIVRVQESIRGAQHIVLLAPIWWSTYPALLKGFFDRVLMPGFAFSYVKGKSQPLGLLKGRTAELVLLSDSPAWYRKYLLGDPAAKILKRDILGFCGIKVNKVHRIGGVNHLDKEARQRVLESLSQ